MNCSSIKGFYKGFQAHVGEIMAIKAMVARRVGFRTLPWREFAQFTATNLGGLLLLMLLVEPWSHTYTQLHEIAMSGMRPDPTFAWLLQLFQKRLGKPWAVVLQVGLYPPGDRADRWLGGCADG